MGYTKKVTCWNCEGSGKTQDYEYAGTHKYRSGLSKCSSCGGKGTQVIDDMQRNQESKKQEWEELRARINVNLEKLTEQERGYYENVNSIHHERIKQKVEQPEKKKWWQ